ncbi:S8 family serine peptidase [Microcoleus sp. Pol11C3]
MTKHLDLVKLIALMELTSGNAEIIVGLIDGPVAVEHRQLAGENIRSLPGIKSGNCTQKSSIACKHGTFVAGILFGKRDSSAPGICPKCTLLLRPIFAEIASGSEQIPSATPQELATAIVEIVDAGVHVLNMSLALAQPSFNGQHELKQALFRLCNKAWRYYCCGRGESRNDWNLCYYSTSVGDSGCGI